VIVNKHWKSCLKKKNNNKQTKKKKHQKGDGKFMTLYTNSLLAWWNRNWNAFRPLFVDY